MKIKKVKIKFCKYTPVYDVIGVPQTGCFIIRGKEKDYISHNCSHGKFNRSERDFYYIPEGNKIIIDSGSDSSHALGHQVFVGFCLVGDTPVNTDKGVYELKDLVGRDEINVYQLDADSGDVFTVKPKDFIRTKYVNDTIRVTLEDGTVIEGTPDHRVMLVDGTYKELQQLTEYDELMEISI